MIKIKFPDGVYSFWEAFQDGHHHRIVFRVNETGPLNNRTPQQRISNLISELHEERDFESAERYAKYNKYRPADMTSVVRWLVGHPYDLFDLIDMISHKSLEGDI